MAFKPVVVSEEIDEITYKAQFNGMMSRNELAILSDSDMGKAIEYAFEHTLVEPKIDDIDEYFGTNAAHYDKVISFLIGVGTASKKYFPDDKQSANRGKSSK